MLSGKFPRSEVSSLQNIWSQSLVEQDSQPDAPWSCCILTIVDDQVEHALAVHTMYRRKSNALSIVIT